MHAISKFIITIEIDTEHKIFGFTGRILHGAFLQLLRLKDPLLSENLHKSKDITPFVITPLVKYDKGKQGKFEIRTLDPRIVSVLLSIITDNTIETIHIHEYARKIISIQYEKINLDISEIFPIGTSFRFRFKSPTLFANSKRKSNMDPYPKLEKIWGDLIKKYEFFSGPMEVNQKTDLIQRLDNQIATPNFDLKSVNMTLGKNIKLTGFVGSVLFVVEQNENMEILSTLLKIAENWGVGGKLALGFGLVKIKIKIYKKENSDNNGV